MGAVGAIKHYIETMIKESEPGYKIMLMDKETTSIVSVVLGMSEVMKQEVYMFEQVEQMSSGENMSYLKCIVFLRPTSDNIALLCQELQHPRYGAYYIYFSNVVSKASVKQLAESDEQELVREVQEIYADYLALAPHLATLSVPRPVIGGRWSAGALQRVAQGVTAIIFSLSLLPDVRYQANSSLAQQLAEEVRQNIVVEGAVVANTGGGGGVTPQPHIAASAATGDSVLLVLDRRDDPVTPLLHQWTYEAMVHQLLGVTGGRVSLASVAGISDDLREVVMAPTQDAFYAKSMYLNYGEIGQTIKTLMEEYQGKLSKQQKVESISDMKHFVQNYPQFKQMSGTVTKHVTVVGELSRVVQSRRLLAVSECQQELVCGTDHSHNLQRVHGLVRDSSIQTVDAAVLVMLYALRYQSHANNDTRGLVQALNNRQGNNTRYVKLVSALLEYGGEAVRQSPLFSAQLPQDVSAFKKMLLKGVKGVDNVYTQHKPLVLDTATQALKGRLRDTAYPCTGTTALAAKPQTVVVFVIGGVTYEESAAVQQLNCSLGATGRVVLAGTHVHNTETFLEEVEAAVEGLPRTALRL